MNIFKKTLIASALVAASVSTQAEVSINAGVTSDYVWRGVSQTAGDASVSGGIDYSSDSGFYAGTWVGSLGAGAGAEHDLYLGYATDSFDIGYIYYAYPSVGADIDFGEVYASYSIEGFTLGLAYTVNDEDGNEGGPFQSGDLYYYGSYGTDLSEDWTIGFTVGAYAFDNDGLGFTEDYIHYSVDFGTSTSAGDFTFSLTDTDLDSDVFGNVNSDVKAVVSYGVAF